MGKKGQKPRPTVLSYAGRPGTSKDTVPALKQWQCNTFKGLRVEGWALVQIDTPKGFNIHPKNCKTAQDQKNFSNPLPWRLYKGNAKSRQNQRPK